MSKLALEQISFLEEEIDHLKTMRLQEGINPSPTYSRNYDCVDGIGMINLNESANTRNFEKEIEKKDYILRNSEIVWERNFDFIDIGTAFYGRIIGHNGEISEEPERYLLVEKNYCPDVTMNFVSKDAPLGQAVKGMKDGDFVQVRVDEHNSYGFIIDSIDRNLANYVQVNSNGRAK